MDTLYRSTLAERLAAIHALLRDHLPDLARLSVALYDAPSDILHTLAHSSDNDDPLPHYGAPLASVPSLHQLAQSSAARILDDLPTALGNGQAHSRRIVAQGYLSSCTIPLRHHEIFLGFVFFDSYRRGYFTPDTLPLLTCAANLVALTVGEDMDAARVLMGTVIALCQLTRMRDPETGAHLERMSRFARLIADQLAEPCGLSDEEVEDIFLYAPLHDLGKLTTPDAVLLKPGALDSDEWQVMREHPNRGCEIVSLILHNSAASLPRVDLLFNIIRHHHEAFDGSGYPAGLAGAAIPLEARIVAVADAFDALTTARSYKEPWSNAAAMAWLKEHAGTRFDPQCVAALEARLPEAEQVQRLFREAATAPAEAPA